jgi:hypothetical protein
MLSRLLSWSVMNVPDSSLNRRAAAIMSRISFFVVRPPSLGTSVSSAPSAVMWSSLSRLNASDVTMRRR